MIAAAASIALRGDPPGDPHLLDGLGVLDLRARERPRRRVDVFGLSIDAGRHVAQR